MKILFVQPTGDKQGHYGLWTTKLCHQIVKQGAELSLLTNKIDSHRFLDTPPLFKKIEIKNGKYPFSKFDKAMQDGSPWYWYGYFRNSYQAVNEAIRLCKKEIFDVVFFTDVEYLTASLLLKLKGRSMPPVVWHVQAANFSFNSYCGSVAKKSYKVFQRFIFKSVLGSKVKGFVVLGEFHKNELRKQLQLGPEFPIEIVSDGADVIDELIPRAKAREKLGIDYAGNIFLYLGVLRKDKGIEYFIEAIANLSDFDFKVIIAGSPFEWSRIELEKMIIEHNLSSKVILDLNYVPDEKIAYYYCAADFVVFPYSVNYSGSCGPMTKGASTYHKPVIVTDVSDIGRMVKQFRNGLVVPPNDASALAQAMLEFLNLSTEDQANLVGNAKKVAYEHSWPKVADSLIEFLKKAVMGV